MKKSEEILKQDSIRKKFSHKQEKLYIRSFRATIEEAFINQGMNIPFLASDLANLDEYVSLCVLEQGLSVDDAMMIAIEKYRKDRNGNLPEDNRNVIMLLGRA